MNWKVFSRLTASILFLLTGETLVQACAGGDDPYDYYPSFFDNRATAEPAFTPFYYTGQQLFYDDYFWEDEGNKKGFIERPKTDDPNLVEWQGYTGAGISLSDLEAFIYSYPLAEISNLYYHLEKGQALGILEEMKANAMTRWFIETKDFEALGYLMHAKKTEPIANPSYDDWEPVKRDTSAAAKLIKNGLQLHAAAKKDFIRTRYAYQVMRTAFYARRYKQTLDLYKTLVGDREPAGEIEQRMLGLKAGALNKVGKKTEAAYLYSRLFAMNVGRKKSDFLSYKFVGGFEDKDAVLKHCRNKSEEAAVHVLHGLQEYEEALPHMQAAYAADPDAKGLEVLMAREIHKVEERVLRSKLIAERNLEATQWYYNRYADYGSEDNYTRERRVALEAYPKQLADFAQQPARNSARRGFWNISLAYLALLNDDIPATKSYLQTAAAQKLSLRESELHRVISTLAIVRGNSTITSGVETELLPHLQWLEKSTRDDARLEKSYRDLMLTVLATAYLKNRDTVKAVYVFARATQKYNNEGEYVFGPDENFADLGGSLLESMSNEKLQEVKTYVSNKKKSDFDTWLTAGNTYSADMLYELEGTKLMRQHRFAEAADVFAKCSQAILQKRLLPDPFIAHIKDQQELLAEDEARSYTKLEFARRMAELKKAEDARSRFQYGTGLYSMTYYGKAHRAFDYYRSTVDGHGYYEDKDRLALPQHLQEYYAAYAAEEAFKDAATKATDNELKAHALWMAAKCWQKRCTVTAEEAWESDHYYRYSKRNPYFAQLSGGLGGTKFFKEARGTCSYLRDYLRKK